MTRIFIGHTSNGKKLSVNSESSEIFIAGLLGFSDRELFETMLVLEELTNHPNADALNQGVTEFSLAWIKRTLSPRDIHFFLHELGLESNLSKRRFARSLMSDECIR